MKVYVVLLYTGSRICIVNLDNLPEFFISDIKNYKEVVMNFNSEDSKLLEKGGYIYI